jgi:histidinol phosphatase-like enzyme (inositol monophosphatase family)
MSVDEGMRACARELAVVAKSVVRKYYRSALTIEIKEDQSPVTQADREAEAAMRQVIESRYPDHGIIGEEYGESNPDAEYRWILDPIDGTKSFILGVPLFVTLIALEYRKEPILGVIDQPTTHQCVIGDGETTEMNGTTVQVRYRSDLDEAMLLTPDHYAVGEYQDAEAFDRLAKSVLLYRCIGDGYAYSALVNGFVDIAMDPIMNIWDLHALIPVVRGAGGVITDWQGGNPVGAESAIAASPALHRKILEVLHGGQ